MGQAIVYCSGCNAQLRDTDFAKGGAFKIEHKVYCKKCVPAGFVPPPPPTERREAKRHGVTTTSGLKAVKVGVPKASTPTLFWVAGMATGIVILLFTFILISSTPEKAPPAPDPEPPKTVLPPPVPPAELAARDALARLLRRIGESPADLEGQQALLDDLVRRAPGTSVAPEVDRERERMAQRVRDRRTAELAEVQQTVRESTQDQAAIFLRAVRGRHSDPAWKESIDKLLADAEPKPSTPAPAEPRTAAAVAPEIPKPKPAPPPPPPPSFPAGWEAALRHATARDYAAALAALDQSPDVPLLQAVAALQHSSLQALQKTPRGQRVALGAVEGAFQRENGGIVEVRTDAGLVEVETGEIPPAALVALARAAGAVDPKAAAAFCLIEGDAAGARSLIGADPKALPERFWLYAEKVARAPTEPGRDMVQAALASLAKPATAAEGVQRLQAVLRDRAEDLFVRRNKSAILTRSQAGRDFLFAAEDLKSSGVFKPGKSGKLESCWTCETDVEPAKQKDTFLELEFSTLPETPYKAWAWVGGCCQEVFEFSLQGTEMEAGKGTKEPAEPGSAVAIPVKPYALSLKKTHAQHNGPKQPARWEWAALPLPRYAKPGPQKIRILSDQKGFSVSAVVVSAVRGGPPSEAEIKELLRNRGERPKPVAQPRVLPLYACLFDGTDRRLVGEVHDKALHGISLFNLCFTGLERNEAFVIPEQGELRFTYFLKSPSELTARVRIERDGGTLPCDIAIPSPVVGTPTEVRLSLTDFKPAFVKGPNIAPGETTRMIYIFANRLDCGLRLDALSVVEIKK